MKPDLFFDEELASLGKDSMLFFIGLFMYADREGRLEDRPPFLRANIFPYDHDFNADATLSQLHPKFVLRYEVGGRRYLWIRNFTKHQRISGKEAETRSLIPPPPGEGEAMGKHPGSDGEAPEKLLGRQEGEGEREREDSTLPPNTGGKVPPTANEIPVMTFPLGKKNTDGTMEWGLSKAKFDEYQDSYPTLDVTQSLRSARQWLRDHPGQRKTGRGMPAFLSRWITRDVDWGRSKKQPPTGSRSHDKYGDGRG